MSENWAAVPPPAEFLEADMPLIETEEVPACAVCGSERFATHAVGFDYELSRAAFFRSQATSSPSWGDGGSADVTLAEAIHASTNAPVNYFDAPALLPSCNARFWDGGITGCNNPVLAAVTEALVKQHKNTDIVALSIGP